jgi:hypothetical protein
VNGEEVVLDLAKVDDFLAYASDFDVFARKFNLLLKDLLEKKEESQ